MRINKFIAKYSNVSRRNADKLIESGYVKVNGCKVSLGQNIGSNDVVTVYNKPIDASKKDKIILLLNKPVGYVCSRNGQGSKTVYDLLPNCYSHLNIAGRLDKDSSGLLLLTNDGDVHYQITHPSAIKDKIYLIKLNKLLNIKNEQEIDLGVMLKDGISKLQLLSKSKDRTFWQVTMHQGRNRQIRRTFEHLGYRVIKLHRIKIDNYTVDDINIGEYKILKKDT